MGKVLRREKNGGTGRRPVRTFALMLLVLAMVGLGLAWMSGGPVPMRTISQDVGSQDVGGQDVTGQVKP